MKRIIGLEGDAIQTRPPYPFPTVKIPPGHIWVEGDAGYGRSQDSNEYGPISVALVTGKLTHMIYPFEEAGKVRWWEHKVLDQIEARQPGLHFRSFNT